LSHRLWDKPAACCLKQSCIFHGKPIGVSEWRTRSAASLPEELRGSLPAIEELEQEIKKKISRASMIIPETGISLFLAP